MNETNAQMADILKAAMHEDWQPSDCPLLDWHQALRAGAQALRETPKPCQWKYDDHNDTWETACGRTWVYECDGPVENKVHFCQGCGGRIVLPPAPSQET